MKILAIIAGTNVPSNSETLANAFLDGVRAQGTCAVETIALRDFPLPHFTVDCYSAHCILPPEYLRLRKAVEEADGILIATPIWNFGVPAHLKNCIDWIGCFGLDGETRTQGTLGGKPFFFIFTGGAPVAAWKGLMRFTTIFVREATRYFDGTVTGTFYEGRCMPARGTFGLVVDQRPDSLERARRRGRSFADFVRQFTETGKLPLYHRLFEKTYKWGQRVAAKL